MKRASKKVKRKSTKHYTKKQSKTMRYFSLCALILFALVITVGEYVGSPLPTWDDLYKLAAGEQHVAISAEAVENTAVKVHFIDVGQGDATLIEQGGEFCLIDAGDTGSGDVVTNYLDNVGVESIDLLIMTHEHTDHIGGMVDVLENFDVEHVLLPVFSNEDPPDGYNILRVLELIDTMGIRTTTAGALQEYSLGGGNISVVDIGIQNTDNKNNASVITMFEFDEFSYLSCGDAEKPQTEFLIENGSNLSADVYKAAHHGASNANYPELLQSIMPDLSIISCGKDNSYGHPHEETVSAIQGVGSVMYGTNDYGDIVVSYTSNDELYVTTSEGSVQIISDAA